VWEFSYCAWEFPYFRPAGLLPAGNFCRFAVTAMTLPALLRCCLAFSFSGRWLGICALALLASGCATTGGDSPSAGHHAPTSRLSSHDGMALLLARIERADRGDLANDPLDRLLNPANDFVEQALAVLGTRYRMGGTSPDEGFDCSGLIWFAMNESYGLELPRTAAALARHGTQVKRAELQRGDLVFFNTMGRRYSHVGIYLGNGEFVHAPSSGGVVRIENLSVRYWNKRYNGARRITQLASLASAN